MTRIVAAIVAACVAILVSLGYYYALNDGYAQPTDIGGTLYRFAGSTSTILLLVIAFLITFPSIVGTRMQRITTAALVVGWVLIELGSMAFSLWFDYEHLGQNVHFWSDVQGFLFVGGYVLLVAGVALILVRLRRRGAVWIAASILIGIVGVAFVLLAAALVRYFLFAVPLAALLAIILVFVLGRKRENALG
jgi:drug/metabolite transporter (DMT)-like permease